MVSWAGTHCTSMQLQLHVCIIWAHTATLSLAVTLHWRSGNSVSPTKCGLQQPIFEEKTILHQTKSPGSSTLMLSGWLSSVLSKAFSQLDTVYNRPVCLQHALTFQCCFAAKETIRLIRDGELRTATSTFTQSLSSAKNAHKQTAARSYLSQTRHCSKLCGWAKTVLEMAGIIPANCYDSRSARADCAGDAERTGAAVHTVIKVALHTVIRWLCLLSSRWLCVLSSRWLCLLSWRWLCVLSSRWRGGRKRTRSFSSTNDAQCSWELCANIAWWLCVVLKRDWDVTRVRKAV